MILDCGGAGDIYAVTHSVTETIDLKKSLNNPVKLEYSGENYINKA